MNEDSLFSILAEYGESDYYPCHMPGHKRNSWGDLLAEISRLDITEIDGFDNLHDAEGLLQEAQELCNSLYGAEESFFVINGSSAGVLAAISAAVPFGGSIIIPRSAHKSAYHSMVLRHLEPIYIHGEFIPDTDIQEAVSPDVVEQAITEYPSAKAVFIVSPTYEGRIADIRVIAKIAHSHNIPLIVDEAHGSHLGFDPDFGENAIQCGADIVIHSAHKTLPALTQTAMVHVQGNLVDVVRLRRFLQIYQSTSPSYILMASLDNAMRFMQKDGLSALAQLKKSFYHMCKQLEGCKNLRILTNGAGRQDIGKLVVILRDNKKNGVWLAEELRRKYRIEIEMASSSYIIAMFTVGDTEEGFCRMTEALVAIDANLSREEASSQRETATSHMDITTVSGASMEIPARERSMWEAFEGEYFTCPIEEVEGRTSADFIYLYPPGAPVIVPGEIYTKQVIENILRYCAEGLEVQGICNHQVRVLMEK